MNKLPRQPRLLPIFIQNHITRFTRDTELYNRVSTLIDEGMSINAAMRSVANGGDPDINLPIVRAAYYRLLHHFDWEDGQEIPNAETIQAFKEAEEFINSPEFGTRFDTNEEAIDHLRTDAEGQNLSPKQALAYLDRLIEKRKKEELP